MQQSDSGFTTKAVVTVRCSGHNGFVQTQNTSYTLDLIQGGQEMHFRGPRIAKTNANIARDECLDRAL